MVDRRRTLTISPTQSTTNPPQSPVTPTAAEASVVDPDEGEAHLSSPSSDSESSDEEYFPSSQISLESEGPSSDGPTCKEHISCPLNQLHLDAIKELVGRAFHSAWLPVRILAAGVTPVIRSELERKGEIPTHLAHRPETLDHIAEAVHACRFGDRDSLLRSRAFGTDIATYVGNNWGYDLNAEAQLVRAAMLRTLIWTSSSEDLWDDAIQILKGASRRVRARLGANARATEVAAGVHDELMPYFIFDVEEFPLPEHMRGTPMMEVVDSLLAAQAHLSDEQFNTLADLRNAASRPDTSLDLIDADLLHDEWAE